VVPTVGWSSVDFSFDGYSVTLYDVGGGSNIRGIWHNYYAEAYGFVFVIDASDEMRMEECMQVIMTFFDNTLVQGKPLLLWVSHFAVSVVCEDCWKVYHLKFEHCSDLFDDRQRLCLVLTWHIYSVSQKSKPLKIFAMFSLLVNLYNWKISWLLPTILILLHQF